ncbi:MAG: hypothetical protein KGK18_16060 [Burkholderiales bacterium]|nr:hypothetical protein [Burkholderiales bacterium]
MRLLFEMTRDDNPRLYDDLIRFNKGTKRVNRLRFLAHEGLLAQTWGLAQAAVAAPAMPAAHVPNSLTMSPAVALRTNHAFSVPSTGEDD